MKIEINCDLMHKIYESKHGFNLNRDFKIAFLASSISTLAFSLVNLSDTNYFKKFIMRFAINYLAGLAGVLTCEYISKKTNINNAKNNLILISFLLKSLNIDTNKDLLMNSECYKTKYKFKFDDCKIPYVLQEKYIDIPVLDNNENNSVSVLQEHKIGSNKYIISRGMPVKKKALKLVFNQI